MTAIADCEAAAEESELAAADALAAALEEPAAARLLADEAATLAAEAREAAAEEADAANDPEAIVTVPVDAAALLDAVGTVIVRVVDGEQAVHVTTVVVNPDGYER